VLEKSDGIRYLMVETTNPDEMFLIDRKYNMQKVFPRFALPFKKINEQRRVVNIFDGEVILDRH
jgi:hypothetical protein